MTQMSDELAVFEGMRPSRTGDTALESQGMAPIPADARYGGIHRMFTVWFTPNMELSAVFVGTLAVVFGLGFQLGLVAIVLGTIIGSIPVAILCTWGPRTGTGQMPLARMPFERDYYLAGRCAVAVHDCLGCAGRTIRRPGIPPIAPRTFLGGRRHRLLQGSRVLSVSTAMNSYTGCNRGAR